MTTFAALNEATTSPDDSALREQVISESGALALRVDNTLDYIDSQSSEIVSRTGDGGAGEHPDYRDCQL